MLLVLTLGSLIETANLCVGFEAIATEVLLITLPTVLFLRRQHVPLRRRLRLKPIPLLTAFYLCAVGDRSLFRGGGHRWGDGAAERHAIGAHRKQHAAEDRPGDHHLLCCPGDLSHPFARKLFRGTSRGL